MNLPCAASLPLLDPLASGFDKALGLSLEAQHLTAGQMSLRAVVVFILATMMIQIGSKRFMGQSTALDVMLGIAFGSLVSRAITGNAPFIPTMAAGLTLVLTHWTISALACRWHLLGVMFKGRQRLLVKNGEIDWKCMRKSHLTENDLHEAMRNHGKAPEIDRIQLAYLERNGDISIVLK